MSSLYPKYQVRDSQADSRTNQRSTQTVRLYPSNHRTDLHLDFNPDGGSQLDLEWSTSDSNLFYNLGVVGTDPFLSGTSSLIPAPKTPSGYPNCKAIQYNPGVAVGEQTNTCPTSDAVQLLLAEC